MAELSSLMSFFDRQAISERLLNSRYTAFVDLDSTAEEAVEEPDWKEMSSEAGEPTSELSREYENRSFEDADNSSEDDSTLSETSPDAEFEDDIAMLRGYSFIAVTKEVHTFEMHRLVQLATRR